MKSRHVIWLLLIYLSFNLPSLNANNTESHSAVKKVFIILRTEQGSENLINFKSLVSSSLELNQVQTQFATYKVSEPIPQMKLFKKAFQENCDFILLIDQIANFNIDLSNKKVNVGGKFKIQSYHLKSSNPSWVNHGESNCNIAIQESVMEFSNKIINSISIEELSDTEYLASKTNILKEDSLSEEDNAVTINEIVIPEHQLKEVLLLKTQIELQKTKTNRILSEIDLLILKTEKQLIAETERNKILQLEIQKMRRQASL
jgi:hypothetical protein